MCAWIRARIHLRVRLGDRSFFVDHVGDAARVFVLFRIGGAVRDADFAIGVAQQREGEVELLGEAPVLFGRVEADAEDLGVLLGVLGQEVPEPGTLARSAGGVGLWIEPEDHFAAAQIGETHAVAVVIDGVEIGSLLAGLEHGRFSSRQNLNDASQGHGRYCRAVTLEEWNARYRTREEIDDAPAQLLADAVRELAPGRALDLACGAGRNAFYLAGRGWNVVALDGASEAIRLVRAHDPRIDARVFDLERGVPLPFDDDAFDLVAILYYLHRPLFAEAKRVLRAGGTLVTAAKMRGTYRVAPGELAGVFEGWDLVHAGEGEIAEVIARKP